VNLSREGVLLTAQGKIHVILDMKGQHYHGVLVRAHPADGGKTAYAIQLTDTVETEQV
jgi:2-oxo-4-hydroxy-4-carboxy--5-ureidoimidazoline (OHCU) decarboxylase